jgi:hypothetical protein
VAVIGVSAGAAKAYSQGVKSRRLPKRPDAGARANVTSPP